MTGCSDPTPPGAMTFPCIKEGCGVVVRQVFDRSRMTHCPEISSRVSVITNPQGNGQMPLVQILDCFTPRYDDMGVQLTAGASAGLMAAWRPTSCFAVAAVRDTNGVLAGEISMSPWEPPPIPNGQEATCPTVVNLASCVPTITTDAGVVTPGGFGALIRTSKSIKAAMVATSVCSANGSSPAVSAAELTLVLDPCSANALNEGENGVYVIVANSDCQSMTVEAVDTGSTTGVCGSISKVIRTRPIVANTADNAFSCTPLGQGVFTGPSENQCFTTSVRSQSIGGIEYKTLVGAVNLVSSDDQLLQCVAGQGMGVFFRPCGAGIQLFSTTRLGGTGTAIQADIVLSQRSNNFLSITGSCGAAGGGSCLEALTAGVNLNSTTMTWSITADPCGGGAKLLDASVKLSTAVCGSAGNGLVQRADGLWSPPDIHVGYWNDADDTHPSATASGALGRTLSVAATNCDPCRCALMCVIARAPAAELQTNDVASGHALLSYAGVINGVNYGQTYQSGFWQLGAGHAHRVAMPGMTEVHWFVLAPNATLNATLAVSCSLSNGTAQISGFRLSVVSFPMGMSSAAPACGQCS